MVTNRAKNQEDNSHRGRTAGYTLMELIVVAAIVAILATQVVIMLSSSPSKLKGAAFNMRSDFNMARSEAVNRNCNVLVDFVFDSGGRDGYKICVDDSADGSCNADDSLIKEVSFGNEVQFYDTDLSGAGGPDKKADNTGSGSFNPGDGVTFSGNKFEMKKDGTSSRSGTVYIYVADPIGAAPGAATGMRAKPYAVIVGGSSTGRVRLVHW